MANAEQLVSAIEFGNTLDRSASRSSTARLGAMSLLFKISRPVSGRVLSPPLAITIVAVAKQAQIMRADAAGFELADARIAAARIIYSDDLIAALDVVFARIEQTPIRRENAMAEKMPVGARVMICGPLALFASTATAQLPGRRANTTNWSV